ncbi:MAG: hypothetical protein PHW10_03550, partial [Candidatus Peribacteraceae bacterium]|nr:hypothetical protein [Candidatus Peribacteraceae bacterium]
LEILKELQLDVPVIGLAKREEEIFIDDRKDPVPLPAEAQAKFLLQRLRDEAHRFANRHREAKGKKTSQQSVLDTVPSVGPETRKKLLKRFGSISGIKAASDAELLEVLTELQMREVRRRL